MPRRIKRRVMLSFPTPTSPVAFALPAAVSPTLAGIVVGAIVGVIAFMAVVVLASRRGRRRQVVTIPPYATGIQRITPMPNIPRMPPPPQFDEEQLRYEPRPRFMPNPQTTQLSASALAAMGCPVGPFGERIPAIAQADTIDADEVDVAVDLFEGEDGNCRLPVSVAPVVVLASNRVSDTAPHPLAVIPSSSKAMNTPPSGVHVAAAVAAPSSPSSSGTMMRAARIDDLSFDDAKTEIAETVFDEPPKPLTRSDPPRIRKIQPGKPRYQRGS
jgi:hypothetical protein